MSQDFPGALQQCFGRWQSRKWRGKGAAAAAAAKSL